MFRSFSVVLALPAVLALESACSTSSAVQWPERGKRRLADYVMRWASGVVADVSKDGPEAWTRYLRLDRVAPEGLFVIDDSVFPNSRRFATFLRGSAGAAGHSIVLGHRDAAPLSPLTVIFYSAFTDTVRVERRLPHIGNGVLSMVVHRDSIGFYIASLSLQHLPPGAAPLK
jgi:hypothetical protein